MRCVRRLDLIGAALALVAASAAAQERSPVASLPGIPRQESIRMRRTSPGGRPMATLPNTEVRSLRSRFTSDAYDVYVFLPTGYGTRDELYPVVYHPDAYYTFGAFADLARNLQDSGVTRKFLVVGISEGVGWDSAESHRVRDFTTGIPAYLAFVRQELIPFVESEYRADPRQRCLHGASLGALFGAKVLLDATDTFSAYVLSSPAFQGGDEWILKEETRRAKGPRELAARVFMTIGGEEAELLSPFDQFCRQLRNHGYRGLDLTVLKADGQVHETAAFVNLPTVLRRLYRP
jgi:predicted alpha/beta superfamily hydrolase